MECLREISEILALISVGEHFRLSKAKALIVAVTGVLLLIGLSSVDCQNYFVDRHSSLKMSVRFGGFIKWECRDMWPRNTLTE